MTLFVSAPLPKPLTRHVSLTWIYADTAEQNELQVRLDTTNYPSAAVGEAVTRMVIDALQRKSQETEVHPGAMGGTDRRRQP